MTVAEQVSGEHSSYRGWVEFTREDLVELRFMLKRDAVYLNDMNHPSRYLQRSDRGFLELMNHNNTRGYAFFTGSRHIRESSIFIMEMPQDVVNISAYSYQDKTLVEWQLREAA